MNEIRYFYLAESFFLKKNVEIPSIEFCVNSSKIPFIDWLDVSISCTQTTTDNVFCVRKRPLHRPSRPDEQKGSGNNLADTGRGGRRLFAKKTSGARLAIVRVHSSGTNRSGRIDFIFWHPHTRRVQSENRYATSGHRHSNPFPWPSSSSRYFRLLCKLFCWQMAAETFTFWKFTTRLFKSENNLILYQSKALLTFYRKSFECELIRSRGRPQSAQNPRETNDRRRAWLPHFVTQRPNIPADHVAPKTKRVEHSKSYRLMSIFIHLLTTPGDFLLDESRARSDAGILKISK